ncbi:putative membrane protein [Rickettsia bellii str. RML An4]|uniref:Putative membrane protein n=1 Tax=Rickettsia bellii str. RML An4 TaxID=1359193 RepID=A0A0F3QFG6_RICBE|nr:putative membrane protein [Rickettsia bellii str. RML An4]
MPCISPFSPTKRTSLALISLLALGKLFLEIKLLRLMLFYIAFNLFYSKLQVNKIFYLYFYIFY